MTMSRKFSRIMLIMAPLLSAVFPLSASAEERPEYEVKAAFVYNFAKFVEWPTDTFKDSDTLLRICVLGKNPFDTLLEAAVAGKTIAARSVVVVYATDLGQVPPCPIMYIARSEAHNLEEIQKQLEGTAILTVSDIDDFAERGGTIGFFVEDKNIRFKINVDAAEETGLQISSKLLRLARIVE